MPTRDGYAAGVPCWIDLMTPDVDASKAFYTELFGWDAEDQFDGDTRIYTNFTMGGRTVAGMGGQMPGMEGAPPVWNTYIASGDLTATTAAIEAAGGKVMLPPMEVMSAGSMAVYADPAGAIFSVWQAGEHTGAEVVNEAGAWSWNELVTRDRADVVDFYSAVFGWEYDETPMGPLGTYLSAKVGGSQIAGLMNMPAEFPDRVPNHWGIYVTVDDADAVCARARGLGAQVVSGPMNSPAGRLATLHDPHLGTFSIMQPPA